MSGDKLPAIPTLARKGKGGRPRKADLEKAKNPGLPGRPPGTAARIEEFKARLLATSGQRVIDEVVRKALDPGDKDQAAMLKMCLDRLLPLSLFEKQTGGKSVSISINLVGAGGEKPAIDAEDIAFNERPDGAEESKP